MHRFSHIEPQALSFAFCIEGSSACLLFQIWSSCIPMLHAEMWLYACTDEFCMGDSACWSLRFLPRPILSRRFCRSAISNPKVTNAIKYQSIIVSRHAPGMKKAEKWTVNTRSASRIPRDTMWLEGILRVNEGIKSKPRKLDVWTRIFRKSKTRTFSFGERFPSLDD